MKKVRVTHKNFNGGKPKDIYHCLPDTEFENQFNEIFHENQYEKGRRKKDAVYIDFGANIGLAFHYFKDYAKEYYAYEPNPEIYQCLVMNTREFSNIKTHNVAISTKDGWEYMYKTDPNSPAQMMVPESQPIDRVSVPTVSAKTVFEQNNITHCDVLKIDVEGNEYAILPSHDFALMTDRIDFILGESHFVLSYADPHFIPLILEEYGYTTTFMPIKNMIKKLMYKDPVDPTYSKTYSIDIGTMFYAEKLLDKKDNKV